MKIAFQALGVVIVYVAAVLLVNDYIGLRNKVSHVYSVEQSNSSLQQKQDSQKSTESANRPDAKGQGNADHSGEKEPKWTDIAIAAFTFAIAIYTIHLYWDAKDKGRRELRSYVGFSSHGIYFNEEGGWPKMAIENFGNTPATSVTFYRRVVDSENDVVDGHYPTGARNDIEGVVFKNAYLSPRQRFPFRWLDDRRLMERRIVYGYIDYTDMYGVIWRHKFAWAHRGENVFEPCEEHNYEKEKGDSV